MAGSGLNGLYHIPILSKALDILEFMQNERQAASLEQLYQVTKFSKTTVYRILKTLEHRGHLAHHEGGLYCCGHRERGAACWRHPALGAASISGGKPVSRSWNQRRISLIGTVLLP